MKFAEKKHMPKSNDGHAFSLVNEDIKAIKNCREQKTTCKNTTTLKDLLLEAITINNRKSSNAGTINEVDLSRSFSRFMMEGKINSALRLLEQGEFSKVLSLTDETMQCLRQKHPHASHTKTSYCKDQ